MKTLTHWLETHQLPCLYKNSFGMECPGCGSQTAFIYLLKGDFEQALLLYPPLVLFVILFVLLALHLSFRFRNGGNLLKYFSILTLLSVLINFVYKQTLHG